MSFLDSFSSCSKCELFTAECVFSHVWQPPINGEDPGAQPLGSRVLAQEPRRRVLGPIRAADAAAASCLGLFYLAGRGPVLGDRPLALAWPWAHDPRLRAGPRGVGQPTVATRSLKVSWGDSQGLLAPHVLVLLGGKCY